MSFFGAGQIGGRGTWIATSSNKSVPTQSTSKAQPATSSSSSWQQRMATIQRADFGSLTGSHKHEPHSPPSSPPLTSADEWDSIDAANNNNDSANLSPTSEQYHHPQEGITKCICNRNFTEISCVSCGMTFEGRVRTPCPRHPNTIHLMDMDRCPVCRATNLTEVEVMSMTTPTKTGMMHQSRPH
ncbi:uncharacterized protein [Amphiura filiformis]|uniref:uncharacterized protein n=1 Tax=Amphiura filiformis TaxID=82378 RepID=UPI003B21CFE5